MSVLDNGNIRESKSVKAANSLRLITKNTFDQMVSAFNQGVVIFWENQDGASPTQIASALGTDAKEIFELHYKLGQLIVSVKPEAVMSANSLIGNFTMNEDGTVTVINTNTVES